MSEIKVALVHDWLTGMRGGEYVLEAIAELYPQADLYSLICFPERISPTLNRLPIHTSFLQKLPGVERKYRLFLPLMPYAIGRFDLSQYDLVISSSHCVAKGIRKAPHARHVSYVHTPMRYVWDRYEDYFAPGRSSLTVRIAGRLMRRALQRWDQKVTEPSRVDTLVANSHFIAGQIQRAYGRDAQVIHPFTDPARFSRPRDPKDFYLMVGAFAPYKRVDLAIRVFNELGLPLWIVGSGQDEIKLRKMAGHSIRFMGVLSNSEIARLYSECRAFVFPGKEDFGITPIEALAAGAPVIAFGEGGVCDTVTPECGILFPGQTPEFLRAAVQVMEQNPDQFPAQVCRARAAQFTKARFQEEFKSVCLTGVDP